MFYRGRAARRLGASPRLLTGTKKKPPVFWSGGWWSGFGDSFQEPFELAGSHRVLKFADRLGLNLADTLACHLEDTTHFLERVGVSVTESVTEFDDLTLAVRQGL